MRRAVRIVCAVALAAFIGASAGCATCSTSCAGWDDEEVVRIAGIWRGPSSDDGDASRHRFETENGDVEIRLYGDAAALELGAEYQIAALLADDELQTSLPHDCGCGPTMTHADGSTIETGFWQLTFGWWPSWRAIIFVAFALSLPLFAFAYFTRERALDGG
jgi:hypothetical protein